MFTKVHTPKGTRDYLPHEVRQYRLIEDDLTEIFKLWGYQEIRSPTIEFIEVLSTGVGSDLVDRMFKFQDFDGKILALRAEMTAPVARIVTTRMTSVQGPIRLFYICNVFRYHQSYVDRGREFRQAGVELVGCKNPGAEGETISLLASTLKKIGLTEVRVDIGHANLLEDLTNAADLNENNRINLRNLLGYRNEDRLKDFMDKNNISSQLEHVFIELSSCRTLDEVSCLSLDLTKYGRAEDHMRNLIELNEIIDEYNIEDLVFFDFSLTKRIAYYTGIVFEASVPDWGLPLGGGGRYDNFIEKFGKLKIPATGWALDIDRCLQALAAQGFKTSRQEKTRVLVTSRFEGTAIKVAKALRTVGIIAMLNVTRKDETEILKYAKLAEIDYVVFTDSTLERPATVHDVQSATSTEMMLETFLQFFRG